MSRAELPQMTAPVTSLTTVVAKEAGVCAMRRPVTLKPSTTVPLLLGTGAPGVPVMPTEPSVVTSMPFALAWNDVCVPAALLITARPPVTRRPSWVELDCATPPPMFSVPLVRRIPSPPVLRMVTLETPNVKAELAAAGLTMMAMPLVAALLPLRVSGAAGLPLMDDPLLISWKAPALPVPTWFTAMVTGPPCVVSWTLVGRMIGNVSPPVPR